MRDLYNYMNYVRKVMYQSEENIVTIDKTHFFQLYKLVCDMLQIRNLVNQDEDIEEMLRKMRGGENG